MILRPALAAIALLGAPASAQTARPVLDYASAAKIRDTCLDYARTHGIKVSVVVLENHGMAVTLAHMDGVSMGGGEVAMWKAVSAAKYGRATADTAALNPPANMPSVATIMGGVPIYSPEGVLLGGVGTSGGKPAEDAACGTAGIEAAGLKAVRPVPTAPRAQ